MDLKERVGYFLFTWLDEHPAPHRRDQCLELADKTLAFVRESLIAQLRADGVDIGVVSGDVIAKR